MKYIIAQTQSQPNIQINPPWYVNTLASGLVGAILAILVQRYMAKYNQRLVQSKENSQEAKINKEKVLEMQTNLPVLDAIRKLDEKFTGKLEQMDEKFTGKLEQMDEKFTGKLEQMDEKFIGKLEQMDEKFIGKLEQMDEKFTGKLEQMDEKFTGKLEILNENVQDLRLELSKNNSNLFHLVEVLNIDRDQPISLLK
jgi:hypothetical protein